MLKYVKLVELPVADQDRAVAFYVEKLGFEIIQDAPYQDNWRWIELELPGAQTRILLSRRREGAASDGPRLVFVADDVDATYRQLMDRDVNFVSAPSEASWQPGQRFAQFRDSEGNTIVITGPVR